MLRKFLSQDKNVAENRRGGLLSSARRRKVAHLFQQTEHTMSELPHCPNCNSSYTYEDRGLLICPECGHEWSPTAGAGTAEKTRVIKDANGNVLQDGDTVTVIKDLKVKGSSLVVKVGTKVKNIRLVEGDHDIDCKIDGIGAMKLKSEFVKKV